ncbi:MAG: sigma-70 family RNA polymerase sigma factor [Actinobacteria bacterium]|nr:sigma-70 family RNA polymerase sigma factor [Actinomycetota bacterium]MBI3686119.1 sigma-70 family RNA polymerase sigma factor [Actinomycetota bacterium]
MLLRYLRVVAGDAAEDVASETWLRVIGGLGGFSGEEPGFRAWLVRIARNTLMDGHRRRFRRPETLTPDLTRADGPSVPDVADTVIDRIGTEDALRLVARLPAEVAEMVTLRVVMGLEVADVAALVGRSPGAVRVAVHRGLRRLADQLRADGVTQHGKAAFSGRDV